MCILAARAASTARITFGELPLVLMPISTSVRSAESLHLSLEDALETAVIGEGSQERRVSRQGNGGESGALELFTESADKLCSHVLAIGGTPTIAAQHHLSAGSERIRDQVGRRKNGVKALLRYLPLDLRALEQVPPAFSSPNNRS